MLLILDFLGGGDQVGANSFDIAGDAGAFAAHFFPFGGGIANVAFQSFELRRVGRIRGESRRGQQRENESRSKPSHFFVLSRHCGVRRDG